MTGDIYFIHGNRVVVGSLSRSLSKTKAIVTARHYVLADGSEQPIYLGVTRHIPRNELEVSAAPLLALCAA